jgi:hypothetical protein
MITSRPITGGFINTGDPGLNLRRKNPLRLLANNRPGLSGCLGPSWLGNRPFNGMLDFRQGFIYAEKDNQNLTIDSDPQGPKNKQQDPLPKIMSQAGVVAFYAHKDHARSDKETKKSADPKKNLDDDRGNHGPEGPEVPHKKLLSAQIIIFYIVGRLNTAVDRNNIFSVHFCRSSI